ncbi:hypothetical protein HXX76_010800 [Chlamydomonas incerta]|uniref:EF-hand domain-containing protein n=1 Tax=Chlamydomonas incerta TaxID=51695 RepID=A0A835VVL9_CHLIN|nr:hypothetical protein HXX76_010800 [Chlamydomonas incerta]|eukprot:KAG2429565.1 hypothetical protein HXX76_010800 [Chlamydomonas incerta]
MTDPPAGSGPNTPRAPPAIVAAAWEARGSDGDGAAALQAPAAAVHGNDGLDSPRSAGGTYTSLRTAAGAAGSSRPTGAAAAAPVPPPPPFISARSRQSSMTSRPRPVAEADEAALVAADVTDEHAGAVAGSGHSVRINAAGAAAATGGGGGVAVADITAARAPSHKPSMSNKVLPAPERSAPSAADKVLSEFDANKDDRLDANELALLVSKMVQEREDKRLLLWGLIAVLVVLVVLIGALTGMTWAVVAAFKDTDVKGGVMYVKGSASEVVQTASSEMTIVDGALINRQALSAAAMTAAAAATANATNATNAGAIIAQPDSVVRTATFVGTPVKFSSRVNVRQLMELKYLYITGVGEVEVALLVQGVARVGHRGARTITLDNTVVRFEEEIAPIFVKAGFVVSHSRRSLLGIYDVLGFFNFIADLEVFNLPPDQPKPALPSANFMMQLKIYEPCVFPFDPSNDRCIAPGADGALNPDDATSNSSSTGARRRLQLQALQQLLGPLAPPSSSGPVLPLLASPSLASDAAGDRRRRSTLATAPHTHARLLQTTDAGSFLHDLAGVEVVNGSRYMTHTETATMWQGSMRTVYEYALFPGYRRVEVASNASGVMDVWQEEDPIPLPEVVEFDYFDNRKDFSPLGFEMNHPVAGHVMIQVVAYRNLTAADVSNDTFAVPSAAADSSGGYTGACGNDTSIPRLSSPFTVPKFYDPDLRTVPLVNPDTLLESNPSPAAGRRLAEAAAQRAAEWAALDHVNGSDVDLWPEWVLAHYGGGGANDRGLVRERLLLDSGRLHGRMMQQSATWCSQNKFTKKWEKAALPCSVEASVIQATHLEVIGSCDGSPITALPNLKIGGLASINTCTKEVSGCAKLSLTLVPYLDKVYVLKKIASSIGLKDMDLFSLCAGYNWEDMEGYVTGVLSPSVVVLRAEIVGTVKWSPCCVWVDEVSMEGFVGVSVGSYDLSSSIGKYWKGSAADAVRNRVPAVQNQARLDPYLVGEAQWGDWGEIQYCHERLPSDAGKSKARPIQGFRLRLEHYLGADADDTSLNGLKIRCANGNDLDVEEGNWGDWQSGGLCSSGKYMTAARIKIEPYQGPDGDDTAANSIEFRCSDSAVITSGSGNYGSWGSWVSCPTNQYICGLQVKMEQPQGTDKDDTAMNGLRFYCCYLA